MLERKPRPWDDTQSQREWFKNKELMFELNSLAWKMSEHDKTCYYNFLNLSNKAMQKYYNEAKKIKIPTLLSNAIINAYKILFGKSYINIKY